MRVTLDIDKKCYMKKILNKINHFLGKGFIDYIYESSSGKGYHIIISDLNITWKQSWILRQIFGDDKIRLKIDKIRDNLKQVTQVLWNRKGKKKARLLYDKKRNINILPKIYNSYL